MTRTLARNTLLRRLLSLWVAFAFVLSMTNVGVAVPVVASELGSPVAEEVVPPVEQPVEAAPETPVAEPEPAPVVEPTPAPTVEPPVPAVETQKPEAPESSVEADPVTAAASKSVSSEGLTFKTASFSIASVVDPVEVPGNPPLTAGGLRIDEADLPGTFTHTFMGIEIEITVSVVETADGMEFSFVSDYPVTKVVAKGGNVGANVYTYSPGVLSDSGLHTPANPSGKWADISHLDFYFAAPADLEVVKYHDLDGDGARDEGEPLLSGWTFNVKDASGATVRSGVTGGSGSVLFENVIPGSYTVEEAPVAGWVVTTDPYPVPVTLLSGQDKTVHVGNREVTDETAVKTFELTFTDAPVGAEFFAVYRLVEGPEVEVALTLSEGVYSGSVELPLGSVIDAVTWTALVDGVTYVLGSQLDLGEVLTEDLVNEYAYSASVSGHKFGDDDADGVWDEDEAGLAGWTIGLYRASGELQTAALPLPLFGYELVAQTVTGAGGAYSFTGLLPGTYYVAEEMQDGWFMTVGPEGTFEVSNGTALTGLDFGNAEEGLPFTQFLFEKRVDRRLAEPGDIVQYTLVYTLTEDSAPWTGPIPVIDDYDETYMTPVDVGDGVVAGGTITWTDEADMAPGETRMILYTMRVNADMPVGETEIPNFALLDVQDGLRDEAGIVVTVDEPALPFTEFEFDKRANLSMAKPGDVVTYTLTYTLTEDSDAWTDPIPIIDDFDERYMTPVDAAGGVVSNGTIRWIDNEDMEPGETRTIVYTMKIDAEMPTGTTVVDNVAVLDVQDGYEDDWSVTVRVDAEPFLPFTGNELMIVVVAVLLFASAGFGLRLSASRVRS